MLHTEQLFVLKYIKHKEIIKLKGHNLFPIRYITFFSFQVVETPEWIITHIHCVCIKQNIVHFYMCIFPLRIKQLRNLSGDNNAVFKRQADI